MAADGPAIGRLGGRALRRPLIIVVAALAALFGCPMLPVAVVRAEGEAGNAAPDATDDVVVAPAVGATVTLRGIDTDGDDLTFGVLSPSGVTLGDVSTPSCETPAGGPRVCTATVHVTPAGGTGSFDFTVSDPAVTATATVTVVNSAPAAVDDSVVAAPGSATTITLRALDPEGDALSFATFSPSGGSVGEVGTPSCAAQPDGSSACTAQVTFTNTSASGSFGYTASDGVNDPQQASVAVANPRPAALDDSLVAAAGSVTTVTLRGIDPNGDALSFATFSPSGGTLGEVGTPSCAAQSDGSSVCTADVTFTNVSGNGTFGYTVSDGVNDPQQASVAVANPRPAALDDSLVAAAGSVTTVTLRGIDPNGDALSFATFSPSGGTLGEVGTPSCAAQSDGSSVCTADVTFTNVSGNGTFGYTVSDGVNDPQQASVAVANPRPAALDDSLVAAAGSVTTVTLRGIDPNGDALSFATFSPSGGTLGEVGTPSCAAQSDGSSVCTADVTFTNVSGNGTFGYTVSDGVNDPQQASVAVSNPAPAALPDAITGATGPVDVMLRGVDANGDPLTFEVFGASGGTLGEVGMPSCSGQPDGSSVCTATVPFTNSSGDGSFFFVVQDGSSTSPPAVVIVSAAAGSSNSAPVVTTSSAGVRAAGSAVTLHGADSDGDSLSFEISSPSGLTVGALAPSACSPAADGSSVCTGDVLVTPSVTTPGSSFVGSFSYRANDGDATSSFQTVTVTNPSPEAISTTAPVPTAGGNVTLRGADPNGDPLTFEVSSASDVSLGTPSEPVCTPQPDGSSLCTAEVMVTPAPTALSSSWSGSFAYRVIDGSSTSSFETVTVSNPSPKAISDDALIPIAGGALTLRGTDPNGDPLTFELGSSSALTVGPIGEPTCTPTGDGSMSCVAAVAVNPLAPIPSASWSGSLAYRVNDGSSTSSFETITVGNASPAAADDHVVVPAAGGSATLLAADASGDDVTFEVGSASGVIVGSPGPTSCATSGATSRCIAEVTVTPVTEGTLSTTWGGSFTYRSLDGASLSPFRTITVVNPSPETTPAQVSSDTVGTTVTLRGADANGDPLTFEVGGSSGATVSPPGAPACSPGGDGSARCQVDGGGHAD